MQTSWCGRALALAMIVFPLADCLGQNAALLTDDVAAPPALAADAWNGPATPCWLWLAGAEATYLSLHAPVLETDRLAYTDILDFGFEAAPRIWLGAQNAGGWGGRVRYWQFDADTSGEGFADTVAGGGAFPDAFIVDESAKLSLYTLDAEALRTLAGDVWRVDGTFGGRYLGFEYENHRAAVKITGPSPTDAQSRVFTQDFFGGGLTGSAQVTRRLDAPGWSLFGNFRGSAVWGTQSATEDRNEILGGNPFVEFQFTNEWQQTSIWIVETQFGAQWSHYLECCRGEVFVRAAFEYQHWDMVTGGVDPTGSDPSRDFDLLGVAFSIGLMR